MEVQSQSVGVQLGSVDGKGDAEVVAVGRFAFTSDDERMRGTELGLNGQFVHAHNIAPRGEASR